MTELTATKGFNETMLETDWWNLAHGPPDFQFPQINRHIYLIDGPVVAMAADATQELDAILPTIYK